MTWVWLILRLKMPISGMRLNKKSSSIIAYLAGPILILIIWSVISSLVGNDTLYLASPKETFTFLWTFLNPKNFILILSHPAKSVAVCCHCHFIGYTGGFAH